jgi:phosphate acyltransferase
MHRIAVDAMGTDNAPAVEVAGVLGALAKSDLSIILVGDEENLRGHLAACEPALRARVQIRHAPDVIRMDDAPSIAVKQKKQSSMRVCFDLVKSGEAHALVSAGNSGAAMACGLFVLGRLEGVDRPAIVTSFPTMRGPCALLDMGANVDTKATVLAQFATMGAVYSRLQHKTARPRVGLLSNGSEEHKGTNLTRETHKLLERAGVDSESAAFDYVGYVEGRDIFKGEADVVVTDGFTGNVILKSCEGLVEWIFHLARTEIAAAGFWSKVGAWLMKPAFRNMKRRADYAETGGAPLLGVDGVVMICHGGSQPRAIQNAILAAERFCQSNLGNESQSAIANHAFIWETPTVPTPGVLPS